MTPEKQRKPIDRLAVLDYIQRYQAQHQRSPSQRHVARALQLSAPSRANYAVKRLKESGLLDAQPIERGLALEITITETGVHELEQWRARQQALQTSRTRRGTT